MNDFIPEQNPITKENYKFSSLSAEDTQKFVSGFAWLIQELKKQKPELYKLNTQNTND